LARRCRWPWRAVKTAATCPGTVAPVASAAAAAVAIYPDAVAPVSKSWHPQHVIIAIHIAVNGPVAAPEAGPVIFGILIRLCRCGPERAARSLAADRVVERLAPAAQGLLAPKLEVLGWRWPAQGLPVNAVVVQDAAIVVKVTILAEVIGRVSCRCGNH
jgi:hypothetical protein